MAYLLHKDGFDHYGVIRPKNGKEFEKEELHELMGVDGDYYKLVGIPISHTEEYLPLLSAEKGMKCDYLVFSVLQDEVAKMYCNDHIAEHKKEYDRINKKVGKPREVSMLKDCLKKEGVDFSGDYPSNITYCYSISANTEQDGNFCLPFKDFKDFIFGSVVFCTKEEYNPTLIRDEETESASEEYERMLDFTENFAKAEKWCKENARTDYSKWLKKFVPYKWNE